jgi:hypothetical protein
MPRTFPYERVDAVSAAAELAEAVRQRVPTIEVTRVLRGMPMITLAPGVRLRGGTLSPARKACG